MAKIFIESNTGRFANQLFPIFCAITIFEEKGEYNKILFKNYFNESHGSYRIHPNILKCLPKQLHDIISFDEYEYDNSFDKFEVGKDIYISGFCQDLSKINIDSIRKYFECPKEIKNRILSMYGNVDELVCVHVRRGDFLSEDYKDRFISPSKEYIHKCMEYFKGENFIFISDDINWCKENFNQDNVIFADKCDDFLIDFYIQTLTKGNILSASSFSVAGAILNPNKNCVMPNIFLKAKDANRYNLWPEWAIKEDI
jgi:hypothetical protein